MLEDLAGKLTLVTGASTGIGAAVARAFAQHGAAVAAALQFEQGKRRKPWPRKSAPKAARRISSPAT